MWIFNRMALKYLWHHVTRWWSAGICRATRQYKLLSMMLLSRHVTGLKLQPTRVSWQDHGIKHSRWVSATQYQDENLFLFTIGATDASINVVFYGFNWLMYNQKVDIVFKEIWYSIILALNVMTILSFQFWDTRSPNPMLTIQLPERCYCADVVSI